MIERGIAGADEVVLAFLRAEIDSPRFGPVYTGILQRAGRDRATLVDHPDRTDAAARHFRHAMLKSIRGWNDDKLLFAGFPDDSPTSATRTTARGGRCRAAAGASPTARPTSARSMRPKTRTRTCARWRPRWPPGTATRRW